MYGTPPEIIFSDGVLKLAGDAESRLRRSVLAHDGTWREPLLRHRVQSTPGAHFRRPTAAELFDRCSDERILYSAFVSLRGEAAGPDGIRLSTIDRETAWSMCRRLSLELREGNYLPESFRRVDMPKVGKPGVRTLCIGNISDRVVAKAVALVLGPLIWPSPISFGIGGGLHAALRKGLDELSNLAQCGGAVYAITADIRNAFDHVDQRRLEELCRTLFPSKIVDLIQVVLSRTPQGVPQGSPLSPLLFDLFTSETVDRPWIEDSGISRSNRLLRYVDDLIVFGQDPGAVRDSAERLTQTCSQGGFDLGINGQPVDLRRQTISWLGFRFGLAETSVVLHLADDALERLRGSLKTDFDAGKNSVSAWHVLGGWLTSMGPAVGRDQVTELVDAALNTARQVGFDELPPADQLGGLVVSSRDRFAQSLRRDIFVDGVGQERLQMPARRPVFADARLFLEDPANMRRKGMQRRRRPQTQTTAD